MIELKVHCDCGQKFKFDVEPVNGTMPFTVACPICKRDGTAKANVLLQQMSVFKMVEPAPGSAPASAAPAPPPPPARISVAPPAAVSTAAPAPAPIAPIAPPPPAGPSKLRINATAHAAPAPTAEAAPPALVPAGAAPPPIGARPRIGAVPAAANPEEPGKKPSFMMGLLGALVGALVGSLLYFIIYKTIGPLPFLRYGLALGVGGLTGWLANLLGKGEGSKELGSLAAVFTVIAILGAQYLLQSARLHSRDDDLDKVNESIADGGYSVAVKEAKDFVKVVPTGSDAEIRMYIAKQQSGEGEAPKLETVSSDEVKQFRESELTNYMDLASGKETKEQYWAKNNFDPVKAKKILDTEDTAMTGIAVVLAVFKAGIISMIVGAGLAFKLSANA